MWTFLIQITPFLVSILFGIIFFFFEEYQINHEGMSALVMGVASGLLSVPIIFIFYQIFSNYSERHIRNVVTEHVIFEMNYVIVRCMRDLKDILRFKPELSRENLYSFLLENKNIKEKKLSFNEHHIKRFARYKSQILQIVSSNPRLDMLPVDVVQNILSIAKELGIISVELESKQKNRSDIIRASLETLIDDVDRWIEFCEMEAVVSHHTFSLV